MQKVITKTARKGLEQFRDKVLGRGWKIGRVWDRALGWMPEIIVATCTRKLTPDIGPHDGGLYVIPDETVSLNEGPGAGMMQKLWGKDHPWAQRQSYGTIVAAHLQAEASRHHPALKHLNITQPYIPDIEKHLKKD